MLINLFYTNDYIPIMLINAFYENNNIIQNN